MTPFKFDYEDRSACPCGAHVGNDAISHVKIYIPGYVRFKQCLLCGTWIQSPTITTASLAQWYNSDLYQKSTSGAHGVYLDYIAGEPGRIRESIFRHSHDLNKLIPQNGTVLEVGCATGSLLSVLKNNNYTVTGVDLSQRFSSNAKTLYGLDVIVDDFLRVVLPESSFDCIIMLGTISNLPSVEQQLLQARRLLKPGGVLYFNFPAADAFTARLYGHRFWMYAPSVINFFTRQGCRKLLERCGYEIISLAKDRQCISLEKLLGHSGLGAFYPFLRALCGSTPYLPFAVPVPSIFKISARSLS